MILRRPLRQILIALGVGAIGAVVLAVLASPGRLADHWGREWDGLPDADIPARMRQLAELGDDGIAAVAEALGSRRLTVTQAAEATLHEQLDEWHDLRLEQSAQKVSHLVRCLAKQSPHFAPKARRVAADLATRALLWPVDGRGPDRDRLVHDCDTLMRAAASDVPTTVAQSDFDSRHDAAVASKPPVGERPAVGKGRFDPANTDAVGRESPAPHPGGGLPIDTAQVPAFPPSPQLRNELVQFGPPRRPLPPMTMERRDDEAAGAFVGETVDEAVIVEEKPPARFEPALSRRVPWQPRQSRDAAHPPGRRMSATLTHRIDDLAQQDDLEVMRQLHAGDSQQAQLALEELARRGFDDRHLRMAEELTNADPQVRLRFAQALPRIRDVDIRPWLKTLANDDHPDVRMAAIAIIATTGSPDSSSWLRELELRERDPRVAEQLRRVLDRR